MSRHTPWRGKAPSTPEEAERRENARRELERELAEYYDTHSTADEPGEEVEVERGVPVTDWDTLIGRRVQVVLYRDNPVATLTGVLRSLSDDGEVGIETGEGLRYGWPALEIIEVGDDVPDGYEEEVA